MSSAARSVQLFAGYLVLVGLTLIAVPNVLFGLLGIPTTEEPWIRVVGLIVLALSLYYHVAARDELVPILRATVGARLLVGVGLVVVAVVWGYWAVLLFAAVDVGAGLWTAGALRRDAATGAEAPGHVPTA